MTKITAEKVIVTMRDGRPNRVRLFDTTGRYLCDVPCTAVAENIRAHPDRDAEVALSVHRFRVQTEEAIV